MANTFELERVITLADEVAEQIIASLDSGAHCAPARRLRSSPSLPRYSSKLPSRCRLEYAVSG